MVTLSNNFDGGPAGTTVTTVNSGQIPGNDPFDSVDSSGTGTILRFAAAAERSTAEYVLETGTGTTATTPHVAWSTSMGAQSTVYARWYAKFTQLPTSTTVNNDNCLFMIWSGATHCCSIWLANSAHGTAILGNPGILASPGVTLNPMSAVIDVGKWCRFEFRAVMSTTVGVGELRLYEWPNEDGDTPTDSLTITGQNFGAATGSSFRLGCGNPLQSQTATMHSNWELNNTGWPGPAPFRAGKGVPGIMSNPVAIHTDVR